MERGDLGIFSMNFSAILVDFFDELRETGECHCITHIIAHQDELTSQKCISFEGLEIPALVVLPYLKFHGTAVAFQDALVEWNPDGSGIPGGRMVEIFPEYEFAQQGRFASRGGPVRVTLMTRTKDPRRSGF